MDEWMQIHSIQLLHALLFAIARYVMMLLRCCVVKKRERKRETADKFPRLMATACIGTMSAKQSVVVAAPFLFVK